MEQFGLKTRIIMGDGLDSLTAGMICRYGQLYGTERKGVLRDGQAEQGRCGMAGIFRYCR